MARDYKKEYERYQGTPEQRRRNDARKKARREAEKLGLVRKGDGKDIDHKNGNPMDNRPSNWAVKSASANRSYPRTKTARKKNPRD